ncbi:MAG: rod shape-determining protein MreD [Bacteroidales bacterium]|nr:rod shape-determining protein MreD [Bacteroidales bacterium]
MKIVLRFFFLVTLQLLVLNHIQWSGYLNPYLYVLFILLMPFETPNWLLILFSFLLGLTIDSFSNTWGMHSAASVLMAYVRPSLLKIISPREGYEKGSQPIFRDFGFEWIIKYSLILIFIHHFALFYIEVFKFSLFFHTLLRVILSTLFTFSLVLISHFIIYKR